MASQDWYFIRHLIPGEVTGNSLPFEVQILGPNGTATECLFFDGDCWELKANGAEIPSAVLDAAKRYPMGFSDYIDPNGQPLDMFGNCVEPQPIENQEQLAASLLETANRLNTMPSPVRVGNKAILQAIVEHYADTSAAKAAARMLSEFE